jgi:UDP-N-acetylglucosamine transferase subunit ALG13
MNNEGQDPPLKILVAPLDWGLGHATRCIPLVHRLIAHGCQVILAGDGRIKTLLKEEFPLLEFLDLPGYKIRYPASKWKMPFKIAAQIPQILQSINVEQQWLQKAAQEKQFDGIISDNRYGLFHSHLPTVFITHQLRIQTPLGRLSENLLQQINYSYINKFSFCWVPDLEGSGNLGGKLSHPGGLPAIPIYFVGPLSRFYLKETAKKGHILFLISGPEPQRTLWEEKLIRESADHKRPMVVVRGIPGDTAINNFFPLQAEVYSHLASALLEKKISEASLVISRCGYSSVMDLAALKKKSILVPTPGQTEQEYLADHLMENNYALCIDQEKFRLKQCLELAENFIYKPMPLPDQQKQDNAIKEFLSMVIQKRSEANK